LSKEATPQSFLKWLASAELELSPQKEIEDRVLETLARHCGTEKYPEGMTASEIARFVHGLGRADIQLYADSLVGIALQKHKPGKAVRYFIPEGGLP
jgi:hypothetical protein